MDINWKNEIKPKTFKDITCVPCDFVSPTVAAASVCVCVCVREKTVNFFEADLAFNKCGCSIKKTLIKYPNPSSISYKELL